MHVLGVMPGSARAAEDAYDLIAETNPQWVYIDEPPELLDALREEVAAGRVGKGFKPGIYAPSLRWRSGAGLGGSIRVRQALADNETFALLGAELYAPQKAAICAALRGAPTPAAAAAATALAGSSGGAAGAAGTPELIPYPMKLGGLPLSFTRNDQWTGSVFGDENGWMSSSVHGLIGPFDILHASGSAPILIEAALQPERTYLTRREVADMQRANQEQVSRAWSTASAQSADVVTHLETVTASLLEAGDTAAASIMEQRSELARSSAKAIAYTLRTASDRLQPGKCGVAIVNIGTMGPLSRHWSEADDPAELFPVSQLRILNGAAIAAGLGAATGFGWGFRKFYLRFRKSAIVTGVLLGVWAAAAANVKIYQENTTIGPYIREVLANPKLAAVPGPGAGPSAGGPRK